FDCAFTGADAKFYEPSKSLMKKIAYYYGLDTPGWAFLYHVDMSDDSVAALQVREATDGLTYPMIVKHHNGYSSIGMGRDCKVHSMQELVVQVRKFVAKYGGALVEEFISGREFTVLVVENPPDVINHDLQQCMRVADILLQASEGSQGPEHQNTVAPPPYVYPPLECKFGPDEDFKHFDLKWRDYDSIQWHPMSPDERELQEKLKAAAAEAFLALDGRSYGRCDFRVDKQGKVYFLEINPNCGVFYAPGEHGSADCILAQVVGGAGHGTFLDSIVKAAIHSKHNKENSKVTEVRYRHKSGYGLYATRDVAEGEIVVKYEDTEHVLMTKNYALQKYPDGSRFRKWFDAYAYGINDEVWVTWSKDPEAWLPINHSCDPNAWLVGLDLVARRPITKGEQVSMEYATFCVDNMTSFDCMCGTQNCRTRIHGSDYVLPSIEKDYKGHMSFFASTHRQGNVKQQVNDGGHFNGHH
ncbi:hypothetical protein CEUSTIGMA_g11832.t1, partial [Chlamydomonas eustigma]